MSEPVVYGLPGCDTCRRARRWLEGRGVEARFWDVRTEGLDAERLGRWADAAGWDALINRRSRTWRELPEDGRRLADTDPAGLLVGHPTLLKRPLLESSDGVVVGFQPDAWSRALEPER